VSLLSKDGNQALRPGVLSPRCTATLLAVMHGARFVRQVMNLTGSKGVRPTWGHLVKLRELGLVSWETGKQGTLHATVAAVPFGPQSHPAGQAGPPTQS
jgi:hypothetical protein